MVGGRVDPGVQSVVRVMKVMVVDVVGMVGVAVVVRMEAMKAVGRFGAGEAGRAGMRSPPQRVTRGRGTGRPQLDGGPRDRVVGTGCRGRATEKERYSFRERAGSEKQSWQDKRRLSDGVA